MTGRRKASEIPKAELVWMIARLRGVLYEAQGPAAMYSHQERVDVELDPEEVLSVLEETSFDDDLNETYTPHVESMLQRRRGDVSAERQTPLLEPEFDHLDHTLRTETALDILDRAFAQKGERDD